VSSSDILQKITGKISKARRPNRWISLSILLEHAADSVRQTDSVTVVDLPQGQSRFVDNKRWVTTIRKRAPEYSSACVYTFILYCKVGNHDQPLTRLF